MKYIEELYYGKLNPSFQLFTKNSRYCKIMQQEYEAYIELSKKLSNDNKELLERISELDAQIDDIMSVDSYAEGFRDGARLMIDILLGKNENLRRQ